ncbi:hypothetical protein QBC35DRAFT_28739 [Podospora australis]|uniref:SET domain-containing protein n=1 Tax=Podospora australis TaxID=1536484 RepID=A0AAN6WPM6_9PEZI|nr:hypothetical protein QBC35DRAFT_28739 [Podospora australis]
MERLRKLCFYLAFMFSTITGSTLATPSTCPTDHPLQVPLSSPLHRDTSPWSHPPLCITDKTQPSFKYCVYASSTLNAGHGISFITRSNTEKDILPFLTTTCSPLTDLARRDLAPNTSSSAPYIIRNLPTKNHGRGVFARRHIQRGETFMISFPAVVIDQTLESDDASEHLSDADRFKLFKAAFEQLPVPERALSCAASWGEGNLHENIMRTNAFGVKIAGGRYSGLFPETALMNHDCAPNAVIRFSKTTLATEAVAIRDVEPGEELTISYIPIDLPIKERLSLLESHFNFQCTCKLCSAPPDKQRYSDLRRERIGSVRSLIKKVKETSNVDDLAAELFALVEEEGLQLKLKEYDNELWIVYYQLGDVDSAIKYAEAALKEAEELGGVQGGEDDEVQVAIRRNLGIMRRLQAQKAEL